MPTILIVDDQPQVVKSVVAALQHRGEYELLTAGDGAAGLHLARERHPDLLILDVVMPGLDGLQVLRSLRGDPATQDIAVLMLTVKDHPDDILRGLDAGADYYLPKPFHPRDLAMIVQRHFSGSEPEAT